MTVTNSLHLVTLGLTMLFMIGCIPGSTAESDYAKAGLEEHNNYRAIHNSPLMTLDPEVNENAGKCAEYYVGIGKIDHSCKTKSGAGENLFWSSGKVQDPAEAVKQAVKSWYSEIKNFDFDKGSWKDGKGFGDVGHFTQVVWKGSTKLGIGYATKDKDTFVIGLYSPPGNYNGQYKENVPPPTEGGGVISSGNGGRDSDTTKNSTTSGATQVTFGRSHFTGAVVLSVGLLFGKCV